MNRIDYLKKALSKQLQNKKAWVISAFTITKENEDAYKSDPYLYRLVSQSWGYSFIDENMELVKIDDSKAGEPLFRFSDRITITPDIASNVIENTETSIGNVIFNAICVLTSFGNKVPFTFGEVSIPKLEVFIASKLKDTPVEEERSNNYIYVDEYIKFVDSLQYLSNFAQITSWAATPKIIVQPTGIKAFKKELLKKYEGNLTDPVEVAKFEKELMDFDDAYLKDDPTYGKIMSGKLKDQARRQMFLTIGAEQGFGDSIKIKPVLNSLQEGWPLDDKEAFVSLMSGLRAGSYARGVDTVKGGVSAKTLLRAANNFKIVDTDCGAKLGIRRKFTSENIEQLIGRYIIVGNKSIFIENITVASNYLNQALIVRSPMYCVLENDNICTVCAGKKLSQYPTGVTIPLTEISAIILTASMKAMHSNKISTTKLKWKELFT